MEEEIKREKNMEREKKIELFWWPISHKSTTPFKDALWRKWDTNSTVKYKTALTHVQVEQKAYIQQVNNDKFLNVSY